jgi:predicted DNA binding protein
LDTKELEEKVEPADRVPPDVRKRIIDRLDRERKEKEAYLEFLQDATKSPKLTEWEDRFVKDLLIAYKRGFLDSKKDLSERQLEVVRRLEKKVYAVG